MHAASAIPHSTHPGDTHMLVAAPPDAPPLVVLHGAMVSSALTIREGHPLLDSFRVYAIDVIGQSVRSADVRLSMDNSEYGEWLRDVMDALDLPAAHIHGDSWGGFVARKLAEVAPERISRLALLAPAGIGSRPLLKGLSHAAVPLMIYRTTGNRAALQRFVRSQLTTPDTTILEYFGEALGHYNLDLRPPPLATPEPLKSCQSSTLVLAASDDINFPGPALLERAMQLFPQATVDLLPNCKHVPPTNDPARAKLCNRVASFLLDKPCPAVSFDSCA